jgi:hypothetical protein
MSDQKFTNIVLHGVEDIRRGLLVIQEALGEFGGEQPMTSEPLLQHALEIQRRCERIENLLEVPSPPGKVVR